MQLNKLTNVQNIHLSLIVELISMAALILFLYSSRQVYAKDYIHPTTTRVVSNLYQVIAIAIKLLMSLVEDTDVILVLN